MRDLILHWYAAMGALNAAVADPLMDLSYGIGIPVVAVLLLGLIGATAPCQLTTNASALALVARRAVDRREVAASAAAYVLGKVLVYTVVGGLVIAVGREVVPTQGITLVRRLLGPLMLLLGLYLFGLLPIQVRFGHGIADWIESRAGGGTVGAFVLGTAFSFAVCPTLFLLFFVYTVPLALASPIGVVYPGLFALGTVLPLVGLAALISAGVTALGRTLAETERLGRWLKLAAAVVLILAGINDTATYWLL